MLIYFRISFDLDDSSDDDNETEKEASEMLVEIDLGRFYIFCTLGI